MEIPTSTVGLAKLATSMSETKLGDAVGVAVLKQALDIQEQSASELIQSLPDGTGTQINVTA